MRYIRRFEVGKFDEKRKTRQNNKTEYTSNLCVNDYNPSSSLSYCLCCVLLDATPQVTSFFIVLGILWGFPLKKIHSFIMSVNSQIASRVIFLAILHHSLAVPSHLLSCDFTHLVYYSCPPIYQSSPERWFARFVLLHTAIDRRLVATNTIGQIYGRSA